MKLYIQVKIFIKQPHDVYQPNDSDLRLEYFLIFNEISYARKKCWGTGVVVGTPDLPQTCNYLSLFRTFTKFNFQ